MAAWHIALLAMAAYLVFAFALGIAAGRGRSHFSVSEYAVADRGLGLLVMWFLMGGTIFSAFAFLGGPGWAYSKGAAAFYILAYAALGLLPWYMIGPKVARLGAARNYFSMGDLLGDRYRSRLLVVLVGIVSVLAFIQYLTLQIKGMAYVFNVLTEGHIPFWVGALLAYGIVVVYVVTSGVRGAAWSDVLQAILMLVIAWILGLYLVQTLHGGTEAMFGAIIAERPDFLLIGKEESVMSAMAFSSAVIISTIGFVMWPHLFTKSYTTSEKRIKLTVLAYPVFALFLVPVLFIGFAAIGVVPPDAIEKPDQVLPYLITHELGASGLVYGLIGAGALAAAMSSSDAISHGASVSVGRDIILPLKPDMAERTQLLVMRIAVVAVGGAAYYLAIFGGEGLIQLLLGAYGYIIQLAPPIYGALYWRRASREGAIAGLLTGAAINAFLQFGTDARPLDINPGMLAFLANLVVFVGLSLILKPRAEQRAHVAGFVEA
ncbi:MAG: sodium:solute symporter family protein [Alphaproteobacteria bacterium]|jgi:SSS family solute:Na+ symporter|nr:sodium:solute symporter family protein [Alphaproteobacteria bacterium]